ncbi:cell division topological specificity factor MinE [Endozoicomonas sp. Mp262]|uniref:cell division topological specificity factor MinE n=1 Tax=Endozoicomonas sp. Mp262 TaxID=2919499 RepID=UPI0021D914A1
MSLMQLFRMSNTKEKKSASVAKERLQILVAHERLSRSGSHDFLPAMQKDILKVVRKYIEVNQENINIRLDNEGDCSILEVNVQLPEKE